MSIENITADQAATIFVDDFAARRHEDEVLYSGPSTVTDEERTIIGKVLDVKCKAGNNLIERLERFISERQAAFFAGGSEEWRLAAATGESAGVGAKKYEDIRFVFVSDVKASKEQSWKAVLEIPGETTVNSMLTLKVFNEDGSPAGNGLFTVAGTTVIVENGLANLMMDIFLMGIRESAVVFEREGGVPVSGNLIFF